MIQQANKSAQDKLIAMLQQGIALHNHGRLDEAESIYKKVLLQAPRHADALHLRALACHARERFANAAKFAELAIAVAPAVANFRNTAGEAYRRMGRADLAAQCLHKAIALDPSMAMAHLNLSLVLSSQEQFEQAFASVSLALQLDPNSIAALAQALHLCATVGDQVRAAPLLERLERQQGKPAADLALSRFYFETARAHRRQAQPDQALAAANRGVACDPKFWGNWTLLAELSNEALNFADAERYCTTAAKLAPDNEDARVNLAHFMLEQKRLDEAEGHYRAWLTQAPHSSSAQFGLASVKLLRGEFAEGWKLYEARWGLRVHGGGQRVQSAPSWNGAACKRLLLYAEQGLGDTIQMLRFLPDVVRRGRGAVTLLVPAPLERIARRAVGAAGVTVAAALPAGAAFDRVCPLMSLPHVLKAHSVEQLGMTQPYLAADPRRQECFERALAHLSGKKIGVIWQGGAAGLTNRRRPFALDALAPLLSIPHVHLVSLQYGASQPTIGATPIVDLAEHIADFDDLAAAMASVDMVISVDTGPAHLAGALGRETLTLIPWLHDWRWGIDATGSYWYPTMTLIRQTAHSGWEDPVAKLAARLAQR